MATERTPADEREQRLSEHLNRAGELLRGEKIEAAEAEVTTALRLSPDDVRARNLLGLVRFRAGRYDDAYQVYRELVGRDPDDTALRLNLGLVELRLGRDADASQNLRRVIEQEPANLKAQGYYGLSPMRSGDLQGARAAFVAAGQSDLVKQVDEQIALAAKAARAGAAAPPPATKNIAERIKAAAPAGALDGDLVPIDDRGSGPIALGGAAPAGRAGTRREPLIHERPVPLGSFVDTRELRSGASGETYTLSGGLLVLRIDGRLPTRTSGAIASSGTLAYAQMTRRVRGKTVEETFGEADDALFLATGAGVILISPKGGTFTALALRDKDVLYLREAAVFSFEESLSWENGRVPGGGPSGLTFAQLRGQGRVVVRSKKSPYTLKLAANDIYYVDQAGLLGWTGAVVPQQLRGVDGEPTQYIQCGGEGALLLEEPFTETPPPGATTTTTE